jgi:hypothetical protein
MRADSADERTSGGNLTFFRGYHRDPKTFGLLALVAHQFGFIDAVDKAEKVLHSVCRFAAV